MNINLFLGKNSIVGQKKIDIQQEQKNRLLIEEIRRAESDLELAYTNFENVSEPLLIDYYIYELNALTLRYQYLIMNAKAMGIHGVIPSKRLTAALAYSQNREQSVS